MKRNELISVYDNQLWQYGSMVYEGEDLSTSKGIVELIKKNHVGDNGAFYMVLNIDRYLRPINIYIIKRECQSSGSYIFPMPDLLRSSIASGAYGASVIYGYGSEDIGFAFADILFYLDVKKAAASIGVYLLDYILTDISYRFLSFSKNEKALKDYLLNQNSDYMIEE